MRLFSFSIEKRKSSVVFFDQRLKCTFQHCLKYAFFMIFLNHKNKNIKKKKSVFLVLHLNAGQGRSVSVFSWNKNLNQHLGASPTNVFNLIFSSFFPIFLPFSCKKTWKQYFHQHLESTTPKHWSKYSTIQFCYL